MPLSAGARLGPYEITAELGAGGMGEVWRGRDTKLNRDVALKTLPVSFADDPERRARFQREAQVLAALNHPNIAAIYGFEDSGDTHALVMELVEGPTLEERLRAGAMKWEEVVPLARQMADALEAAHEKGIIHRDLKPANVKITPEGTAKLLDFGLARALDPVAGAGSDPAKSPTLTMAFADGMTSAGMILGTAAYMSPEQARGVAVDRRADIWSFGVVLYEMLTGRRAFAGETTSDVLAAVLRADIDFGQIPAETPAWLRRLVERCLVREPKKRLQAIGEARLLLDEPPEAVPAVEPGNRRLKWLWMAAGLVGGLALGAYGVSRWVTPAAAEPPMVRFEIPVPEPGASIRSLAMSPDGQTLAFTTTKGGVDHLWLHRFEAGQSQQVKGVEGVRYPFWSPDSRFVAYFSGGKLWRMDIAGSAPQVICETETGFGGTWNSACVILFSPRAGSALFRVAASGGNPVQVTKDGEANGFPQFLPDGEHYFSYHTGAGYGTYLASLGSPVGRRVLSALGFAAYAQPDVLLHEMAGALMAQSISRSGTLTGDPVRIDDHVGSTLSYRFVTASRTGVIAHTRGGAPSTAQFFWVDRDGREISAASEPGPSVTGRLSTDGSRVAFQRGSVGGVGPRDIWILDLSRRVESRLTFGTEDESSPVWAPDGRWIAYATGQSGSGVTQIYRRAADGTGQAELLISSDKPNFPLDWSGDGKLLLFARGLVGGRDLWILPLEGDRKPFVFLATEANEFEGRFSPLLAGRLRWIAYTSNETGRDEVYVRGFSGAPGKSIDGLGKWQVSSGGGNYPQWRSDGRELFYAMPDGRIAAVDVASGDTFRPGTPRPLGIRWDPRSGGINRSWDVAPDGQRFLVNKFLNEAAPTPIIVTLNWRQLLKGK